MNILIGSDLVPTKSNIAEFSKGNILSLVGQELFSLWNAADFRILNLEAPISDIEAPIYKNGPHLAIPTSAMMGIKALDPTLLSLANNHIMDHGIQGLESTIDHLNKANICYTGIGNNLADAKKPFILQKKGVKVGLYACAEHEFSIATENTPGANPFDPLESLDHIMDLKAQCDYVIVLYHGGKEHYRYPSPYLQKLCRRMVQKGANLVVCQHSHCIGSYEQYLESTIVYGQGNFLFDDSDNEFEQTSVLINVNLNEGMQIEYIPIVKVGNGICLADSKKASEILTELKERSQKIISSGFIENKYLGFALDNHRSYLHSLAGFGKWITRFDNRLFKGLLSRTIYNRGKLASIRNFIECESHRELLLAGFENSDRAEK